HNIHTFSVTHPATPSLYTLSLHDALPILNTNPHHTPNKQCAYKPGGGKPYKSSTPTRHPTHTTRARHQIKGTPTPTNPAGRKEPKTTQTRLSRNNHALMSSQETTANRLQTHTGSSPDAAQTPTRTSPKTPDPPRFVLYFTGFLRDHQISVSEAFPIKPERKVAANSSRHSELCQKESAPKTIGRWARPPERCPVRPEKSASPPGQGQRSLETLQRTYPLSQVTTT